jgi:type I restriction enzyme S subunit
MRGWPIVALRDVADIAAGITLGRKTKDTPLTTVPYLRVANVQDGQLALTDVKTIMATPREIEKLRLRKGDLLLTEGGDLDKLGRGACWHEQMPVCIHQNHIFRVRLPDDAYDHEFVSLQVGSPYGKAYFLAHAKKTTGIASINQQVLGSFPLLSPDKREQKAITKRLKNQLAEADKARRAAQTQLSDITLLRARTLQAIFSELQDAPRKALGEHATTMSGVTPSRSDKSYWHPAEIPWVKTGEVDFAPITGTSEAISSKALAECSLTLLPPKTVLIAITGEGKTRGRSAVLEFPATTNQHSVAVLPNDTWDSDFLQLWLQSSYRDLRELSEGRGGSRSALSGAQIKALQVPAPDKAVQQDITQRAKAALATIAAMEQACKASLKDIEQLPQRILAQAFDQASP